MKNDKKIRAVANEAAKILKDNPHLKYYQAINRAKEVIKNDMGRKTRAKETRVSK